MKRLLLILLGFVGLAGVASGFVRSDSRSEKRGRETADTATALTRTAFEGQEIKALHIGFAFRVSLRQGDHTGVRLTIDSRSEPYLVCKLSGGVLTLGMQDGRPQYINEHWVVPPTAEITVRSLDELQTAGAVQLVAEGTFTTDRFRLHAFGASKIEGLDMRVSGPVDVDCSGASQVSELWLGTPSEVEIDASGAAKIDFACETRSLEIGASGASGITGTGSTDRILVKTSGAGRCLLDGMSAVSADCSASGASLIECRATGDLRASASGAGRIVCAGGPKVLKQETSRACSIQIR